MMSGDGATKPSILGLCNPLLDITAYVEQETLTKYNLKANDAILAGEEHKNLCKELVEKYPVEYTAGGSAQNVMRVAAGILKRQQVDGNIMFSGCIGKDEFGKLMEQKAKEDGVITSYAISDSQPTGTCAVCLTDQGKNRSLCAFLGASQKFNDQHLRDNWDQLIANTDIIYITGFLIAVSPATFQILGEHIANSGNNKRRFCLNLSANYVSEAFGNEIDKVMKYVDILFGNDLEAVAYAKHKKWDTSDENGLIERIAKKIVTEEEKVRKDVGRVVVFTQDSRPVVLCLEVDGEVVTKHVACKQIPDDEMVDTNGAGDSFAGGFLSQYVQGAPLEHCIEVGSYAAREIIKRSGVSVPDFADLPQLSR